MKILCSKRFMVQMQASFIIALVFSIFVSCSTAPYPNTKDYGEYVDAIRQGNISYVNQFYKKYKKYALTDISLYGLVYNPLEIAAVYGKNEIVKFFFEKGADPNAISPSYHVPIVFAIVMNKNIESISLAIKYGANVDIKDANGTCLIGLAASTGSPDVVKALLPGIKDINAVDSRSGNALFGAVYSGSIEVFNLLVASGIDINKQSDSGNTPLLMAIAYENIPIAELLIELGADVTIINNKGYDAKRLAEHMGLVIKGL